MPNHNYISTRSKHVVALLSTKMRLPFHMHFVSPFGSIVCLFSNLFVAHASVVSDYLVGWAPCGHIQGENVRRSSDQLKNLMLCVRRISIAASR